MKSKYFVVIALVFLALGLSGCTVLDKLGITTGTTEPETETAQATPEAEPGAEEAEEAALPEAEIPDATEPTEPGDAVVLTEEMVANLLAAEHSVDVATIEVTISDARDEFASGSSSLVGGGPGGGYWYAVLVGDGWMIAADGNGVILCSEIAPYDFPIDMISECYDEATKQNVVRTNPMSPGTTEDEPTP